MTDTSWEHAAEARAALNAIVNDPEHGVAALSSAQTMSNLLKDLLPDAPREKSILVAAAEAGLANTLRDHVSQGMDAGTAINLTASSFSATTPFTPDACSWVTGEIANVLGISQPNPTGFLGGTPASFDPIGQQGMPTQMAPGFNQGGFNQGGGFGQAASDPGATAPGAWPPAGGFRQAGTPGAGQAGTPGAGQAGGAAQVPGAGQPTVGAWQAGGAAFGAAGAGQQATPGWQGAQGFGQPGVGQPGPGQPGFGQAGFGQPGTGQATPGWQPGGAGGYGPGGGFGPIPGGKPPGSKRGLWITLSIVASLIVIVIIAVSLSGGGGGNNNTNGNGTNNSPGVSTSPSQPVTSPSTAPSTPVTGIEPLTTIMNPVGQKPVGTDCGTASPLTYTDGTPVFDSATITSSRDCSKTTRAGVFIIGYQFDSLADMRKGLAAVNKFVGFNRSTASTSGCPPPSGFTQGRGVWFAKANPKYSKRSGQILECDLSGKGKPQMLWAMPTQNVLFVSQDGASGDTQKDLYDWWTTLNYG